MTIEATVDGQLVRWRDSKRYLWLLGAVIPLIPMAMWGLYAWTGSTLSWYFGPFFVFVLIPIFDLLAGLDADRADLLDQVRALTATHPALAGRAVEVRGLAAAVQAEPRQPELPHRRLVDQVVEVDEKLMETYLEKGEVTPEELHGPLERAADLGEGNRDVRQPRPQRSRPARPPRGPASDPRRWCCSRRPTSCRSSSPGPSVGTPVPARPAG